MRLHILLVCIWWTCFAYAVTLSTNVKSALQILDSGNVQEAIILIKQAANTNDLLAQFYLAQCYENGIGMTEDKTEAFKMYRKAAERGLPTAMKELSRFYAEGIGVYQSKDKAAEWRSRYLRKDEDNFPNLIEIYNRRLGNASSTTMSIVSDEDKPSDDSRVNTKHDPALTLNSETQRITISIENNTKIPNMAPISDVDMDIPNSQEINNQTFAFIFANEDYQEVANVPHAINDGEIFAEYCQRTLGLPKTNIHLVKNGTLNNIRREINLMSKIAEAYREEISFIVYYAGHGIPDEESRNAYLLPSDGFPTDITTCYSLNDLYRLIGSLPVKRSLIFLDACFSGATRNNEMVMSARGVALKPTEARPCGNTLVIASAMGNETSYAYDEKRHGMFTYFLLKKIKESRGSISIDNLYDYLRNNVAKTSIVINGKLQTPTISISPNLSNDWKEWKLK